MSANPDLVRCVECRREYELPGAGLPAACPGCGSRSWVSARFAAAPEPVRPGR